MWFTLHDGVAAHAWRPSNSRSLQATPACAGSIRRAVPDTRAPPRSSAWRPPACGWAAGARRPAGHLQGASGGHTCQGGGLGVRQGWDRSRPAATLVDGKRLKPCVLAQASRGKPTPPPPCCGWPCAAARLLCRSLPSSRAPLRACHGAGAAAGQPGFYSVPLIPAPHTGGAGVGFRCGGGHAGGHLQAPARPQHGTGMQASKGRPRRQEQRPQPRPARRRRRSSVASLGQAGRQAPNHSTRELDLRSRTIACTISSSRTTARATHVWPSAATTGSLKATCKQAQAGLQVQPWVPWTTLLLLPAAAAAAAACCRLGAADNLHLPAPQPPVHLQHDKPSPPLLPPERY